jgi:hypothetical protein
VLYEAETLWFRWPNIHLKATVESALTLFISVSYYIWLMFGWEDSAFHISRQSETSIRSGQITRLKILSIQGRKRRISSILRHIKNLFSNLCENNATLFLHNLNRFKSRVWLYNCIDNSIKILNFLLIAKRV